MILRGLLSTAAALAVAIVAAVVTAIVDLYVTGHGYPSVNRPIAMLANRGVMLGRADIGLLAATVVAWVVTWRVTRR